MLQGFLMPGGLLELAQLVQDSFVVMAVRLSIQNLAPITDISCLEP